MTWVLALGQDEYATAEEVLKTALSKKNADGSRIQPIKNELDTIIADAEKGKAVVAVVVTSLVKKIITPKQDIRIHQVKLEGGYSGRRLDTMVITPFLTTNNFPAMAESGWLTRSFEQSSPYTLDYKGAINPPALKTAFLNILDKVQSGKVNPEYALEYLFAGLVAQRDSNSAIRLAKPTGLTIEEIVHYLDKHFNYKYSSGGASRLPVLAIYASYMQMMKEVSRYKGCVLLPLLRHNSADRKTDAIGDIQVIDSNKRIFEAVEIKHQIEITPKIVETAYQKFRTEPVKRYYLLTTSNSDNYRDEITKVVTDIQKKCGCQVIVNGVEPTLKYYLRLLENPDAFIITYAELLEKDKDIKYEQREAWNNIVTGT